MHFSTNWKTSIGGGLTAAMGIASLFGVKFGAAPMDPTTAMGMIAAGLSLMFAKDANITGGSIDQSKLPTLTGK